jgi:hypothetical protein
MFVKIYDGNVDIQRQRRRNQGVSSVTRARYNAATVHIKAVRLTTREAAAQRVAQLPKHGSCRWALLAPSASGTPGRTSLQSDCRQAPRPPAHRASASMQTSSSSTCGQRLRGGALCKTCGSARYALAAAGLSGFSASPRSSRSKSSSSRANPANTRPSFGPSLRMLGRVQSYPVTPERRLDSPAQRANVALMPTRTIAYLTVSTEKQADRWTPSARR